MHSEARLSVIVPGYNTSEICWRRCVTSIRSACGLHDEIICVDDGSDVPVRKEWISADCDERVRLIRKAHGGLASARNIAMESMRGRFVTFVDSDDEVCNEIFAKGVSRLETTNADIAIYGVQTVWSREGLSKTDRLPFRFCERLSTDDILALLKVNLFNYVCNKIYRVGFLNRQNGEAGRIRFKLNGMPCEDVIFNIECVLKNARWILLDSVGYIYYRTGETLLSCYKPSNEDGLRLRADAWRRFCAMLTESERETFRLFSELSEKSLLESQWNNIWKHRTPYSLLERLRWLKAHKEIGGNGLHMWVIYCKKFLFSFFRRYFYFRPIRRWNIRRQYPNVKKWMV